MKNKLSPEIEKQIQEIFSEYQIINYWKVSKTSAFVITKNPAEKTNFKLVSTYSINNAVEKYQYLVKIKDDMIINP